MPNLTFAAPPCRLRTLVCSDPCATNRDRWFTCCWMLPFASFSGFRSQGRHKHFRGWSGQLTFASAPRTMALPGFSYTIGADIVMRQW